MLSYEFGIMSYEFGVYQVCRGKRLMTIIINTEFFFRVKVSICFVSNSKFCGMGVFSN